MFDVFPGVLRVLGESYSGSEDFTPSRGRYAKPTKGFCLRFPSATVGARERVNRFAQRILR
jgi:hypothetical protein